MQSGYTYNSDERTGSLRAIVLRVARTNYANVRFVPPPFAEDASRACLRRASSGERLARDPSQSAGSIDPRFLLAGLSPPLGSESRSGRPVFVFRALEIPRTNRRINCEARANAPFGRKTTTTTLIVCANASVHAFEGRGRRSIIARRTARLQ